MAYPIFEPSSRSYSHGEWPVSRQKFMTGRSQQMLFATAKAIQRLRLRYDNRPLADFDAFLDHFDSTFGTNKGFTLPEPVVFAGWDKTSGDNQRFGADLLWRYSQAPRIRSQRGGIGTIEIDLQTVQSPSISIPDPEPEPDPIPEPPPGIPEPTPLPRPNGICPPGSNYNAATDTCDPAPGLEAGMIVSVQVQNINLNQRYHSTTCNYFPEPDTYNGEGCSDIIVRSIGCYQDLSAKRVWPFTWERYEGSWTYPNRWSQAPNIGEKPIGEYGCYERTQNRQNWNYQSAYVPNEGYVQARWQLMDANGDSCGLFSGSSHAGGTGCASGTYSIGSPFQRENDIVRIYLANGTLIWEAEGALTNAQCEGIPQGIQPQSTERSLTPEPQVKNSVLGNSNTSNYFPNVNPSRRSIIFGDYEVDRYGSDQEVTIPLPSTAQKTDVIVNLVYANRPDKIARMFMDHYDSCIGEFYDFPIEPVNEYEGPFAGWDDPTIKLNEGRWIYARPPQIEQTAIDHSTTTIQILNISPQLS